MNTEPQTKNYVRRFLRPLKYQKSISFRYVMQAIIRGLSPILHLVFIQLITNSIASGSIEEFYRILFIYLVVYILYEALWFITKNWGWVELLSASQSDLYDKYLNKYIQTDISYSEKIGTGKAIAIIQKGVLTWSQLLSNLIEKGIELLIIILYALNILSQKGTIYAVTFTLILILGVIFASYINKRQFIWRAQRRDALNYVTHLLVKILMSKNEILETDNIDKEVLNIRNTLHKVKIINQDMSLGRILTHRLLSFVMGIGIIVIMYVYGLEVINGKIELGVLVGLTGTIILIQSNLKNFMGFYVEFTKSFIDIEKIFEFFDNAPTIKGYNEGKDFIFKEGRIEVQNIDFAYSPKEQVFNNFSMSINPGKKVAFVGQSGSGKSTLMKLLAGFLKPDSGNIYADGQSLQDISLKSYFTSIGYLSQDPSIFDGTIADNLEYSSKRELTKDEIDNAIVRSNSEFIYELENGLDTQIGEKGVRLSGGQKQRLAIAKMMLKKPKIIFLDEPTSALDSFNEDQVTRALEELFIGKTVIIIAHRLQTVKKADIIHVFKDGKIVESGSHNTLKKQNGIYTKMIELQSGF